MESCSVTAPIRRLLAAAAVLALASAACSDPASGPGPDGNTSITVGLINGDGNAGLPIHLFGPGEDFPCCQVPQLDSRNVHPGVKSGDRLTFRAGRSGAILATVQCTVDNFQGKIVRWTPTATGSNTGTLSCHTGW